MLIQILLAIKIGRAINPAYHLFLNGFVSFTSSSSCAIGFFTKSRFGDPHEYDMCLNSAHLGYEACAEIILARLDG